GDRVLHPPESHSSPRGSGFNARESSRPRQERQDFPDHLRDRDSDGVRVTMDFRSAVRPRRAHLADSRFADRARASGARMNVRRSAAMNPRYVVLAGVTLVAGIGILLAASRGRGLAQMQAVEFDATVVTSGLDTPWDMIWGPDSSIWAS